MRISDWSSDVCSSDLLPIAMITVVLLSSWGFHAHKLINRMAVFTLPTDVAGFYKNNVDYMTEHAVDADKRCYEDSAEPPRHFIAADEYGNPPFDSITIHWTAAVEDRQRDVLGKGVSVRVDVGGRRSETKKNKVQLKI